MEQQNNAIQAEEVLQSIKAFESGDDSKAFRHTSSHILAQAVKRLFPEAKLGIGPAIENGYYYDFDLDHRFSDEDISAIEKEMKKITKANLPLERYTMPRDEAIAFRRKEIPSWISRSIRSLRRLFRYSSTSNVTCLPAHRRGTSFRIRPAF